MAEKLAVDQDDVLVLADEMSKNLKVFCHLCGKIYRDPYITSCGHTFCHACVSGGGKSICPLDNVQLSPLVKNLALAEQIGELMVHCCYGCRPKEGCPGEYEPNPQGCPVTVKHIKRQEHERECEFAPVECPNSSICGKMLRRDLSDHLKHCKLMRCPHHKYNCRFQGTDEQLKEHLLTCEFEGVKGVLNHMEEEIGSLSGDVRKLESELTSKMEKMETRIELMKKDMTQALSSMMGELKHMQQQFGGAGSFEPQHLFKCQGTFVGHKGPVWALCKCGDLLFSASSDYTIKVWNLSATYTGPRTLTGHDGIVLALCNHGDQQLFSGSSDNSIKVWSVKTYELLASISADDNPVCTLACNDTLLFSGSLRSIKVWDIQTHKLSRKLPSQNHWVRALVVSGKFLYSGSYQAVKIWSLETLDVVHVLQCEGGSVYCLSVTEKHIICGTYENLIHVWDIDSLQELGTLSGHVGTVYSLAVLKAPVQMRLFSASYDKTIRVWNLELMTCSQTMARHEGSVTCLIASRGRIFSGAVDSAIKVWQ